jgi:sec-independent protein translocase protein TatA
MGTPEIMLIMLAVLLLFGGKKLPELARGLGKGIREFKDASDGVQREIHRNINAVHDDVKVDVSDSSASTETFNHTDSGVNKESQPDQTQSKL